mmetsp:Transcript_41767/g.135102  ORF Transcript_41767/g.135102 Transcript_41767/m.135102 type:complete len:333 (+) Transcript_41767:1152-2150(+)
MGTCRASSLERARQKIPLRRRLLHDRRRQPPQLRAAGRALGPAEGRAGRRGPAGEDLQIEQVAGVRRALPTAQPCRVEGLEVCILASLCQHAAEELQEQRLPQEDGVRVLDVDQAVSVASHAFVPRRQRALCQPNRRADGHARGAVRRCRDTLHDLSKQHLVVPVPPIEEVRRDLRGRRHERVDRQVHDLRFHTPRVQEPVHDLAVPDERVHEQHVWAVVIHGLVSGHQTAPLRVHGRHVDAVHIFSRHLGAGAQRLAFVDHGQVERRQRVQVELVPAPVLISQAMARIIQHKPRPTRGARRQQVRRHLHRDEQVRQPHMPRHRIQQLQRRR